MFSCPYHQIARVFVGNDLCDVLGIWCCVLIHVQFVSPLKLTHIRSHSNEFWDFPDPDHSKTNLSGLIAVLWILSLMILEFIRSNRRRPVIVNLEHIYIYYSVFVLCYVYAMSCPFVLVHARELASARMLSLRMNTYTSHENTH